MAAARGADVDRGVTIVEILNHQEATMKPDDARALLRRHRGEMPPGRLDLALRENPDGPVQELTTRDGDGIRYDVIVGDAMLGDFGRARIVWSREVAFGRTSRTVAGGHDFVEASRAQDEVAHAIHALILLGEPPSAEAQP